METGASGRSGIPAAGRVDLGCSIVSGHVTTPLLVMAGKRAQGVMLSHSYVMYIPAQVGEEMSYVMMGALVRCFLWDLFLWILLVVGSRPCSEGVSPGTLVFPPTWKQWMKEPLCGSHWKFQFYFNTPLLLPRLQYIRIYQFQYNVWEPLISLFTTGERPSCLVMPATTGCCTQYPGV